MKDYICLFKVLCINADDENVEECGFCFADSFTEAVKYLEEELYRCGLVEIRHIELLDACPTLSEETWEIMKKELREV